MHLCLNARRLFLCIFIHVLYIYLLLSTLLCRAVNYNHGSPFFLFFLFSFFNYNWPQSVLQSYKSKSQTTT